MELGAGAYRRACGESLKIVAAASGATGGDEDEYLGEHLPLQVPAQNELFLPKGDYDRHLTVVGRRAIDSPPKLKRGALKAWRLYKNRYGADCVGSVFDTTPVLAFWNSLDKAVGAETEKGGPRAGLYSSVRPFREFRHRCCPGIFRTLP
jgi:hypothetical protein